MNHIEKDADRTSAGATSYAPIKSVEKAFFILEYLNHQTVTRVADLAEATGYPTPTVVRLLETLTQLGYVQKVSRWSGYCLTQKVLSLSAGFHGLPEVFTAARAAAEALTAQIKWPAAICSFDNDAMVVRFSTIPSSPLSHKQSTVNRRLEMLTRAHGRAWMAFCSAEERERIWESLIKTNQIEPEALAQKRAENEVLLAKFRRLGYAHRNPKIEPDTTTLAAPIIVDGRLTGTLGVTFFTGAKLNHEDIARPLCAAARSIKVPPGSAA